MPKYTDKTWKVVDAAAETMALAIMGVMEYTDLEQRYPDFTPEERTQVRQRMIKFADRMLALANYDPSTMPWHANDKEGTEDE